MLSPNHLPVLLRPVPSHVKFELFFRQVDAFERKATELEKEGKSAEHLRSHFRRLAKLNEKEDATLRQLSKECVTDLKILDARAKGLIDELRRQHPDGLLNPGEALPVPPAELSSLQEQREQRVLQARDELKSRLGEKRFEALEKGIEQQGPIRSLLPEHAPLGPPNKSDH